MSNPAAPPEADDPARARFERHHARARRNAALSGWRDVGDSLVQLLLLAADLLFGLLLSAASAMAQAAALCVLWDMFIAAEDVAPLRLPVAFAVVLGLHLVLDGRRYVGPRSGLKELRLAVIRGVLWPAQCLAVAWLGEIAFALIRWAV